MIGMLIAAVLLGTAFQAAGQNVRTGDQAPAALPGAGSGVPGWVASPYTAKQVPAVDFRNSSRMYNLIRAGNLYLSLADAIALAVENNLDIESTRFNIPEAHTDILRAEGGGTLRGVDLSFTEPPAGVGGPLAPLLNIAASGTTPSTSVSSVTQLAQVVETTFPLGLSDPFSTGPPIPLYDPTLNGSLNWQHASTPQSTTFSTGSNVLNTNTWTGSLNLQQGFSPGTQYSVGYNVTRENANSILNSYNPYNIQSLGVTVIQPLLRGFGIGLNRRFIAIAKNNERASNLVFRQQVIATVYGVTVLYYDLLALSDDVRVKQETLATARTLYENTKAGVDEGTLAPVELTRAEAQVSGAEQDLVNSQGLFDEQEAIVKSVLSRSSMRDPLLREVRIIPTEVLEIPEREPEHPADELLAQAYANRPDLLQGQVQLDNAQIYLKGSRNELLPELNLVGIAENNGLAGQLNPLNAAEASRIATAAANPAYIGGYGSSLSQLFTLKNPTYGVGLQLSLPFRNRIAQADAVRDELQLRQAQTRLEQVRHGVELQVNDAIIGLRRARASYDAAVKTRMLQEQSLDLEQLRYAAGVDTSFFVIQYQSYLAQARSTEVVARANYFIARAALERAIGTTLEANNISFDEAYHGRVNQPPGTAPSARGSGAEPRTQ